MRGVQAVVLLCRTLRKIGLIWREILELARVSFLFKLPLLVSNPCDMLVKIYSEMQLNDGLQNEAYAFEVSFARRMLF